MQGAEGKGCQAGRDIRGRALRIKAPWQKGWGRNGNTEDIGRGGGRQRGGQKSGVGSYGSL